MVAGVGGDLLLQDFYVPAVLAAARFGVGREAVMNDNAAFLQETAGRKNGGVDGFVYTAAITIFGPVRKQAHDVIASYGAAVGRLGIGRMVVALEEVARILVKSYKPAEGAGACAIQCLVGVEDQYPRALRPRKGMVAGRSKIDAREVERDDPRSVASGDEWGGVGRSGIDKNAFGGKTADGIEAAREVERFVLHEHAETDGGGHAEDQYVVRGGRRFLLRREELEL